MIGLAVAITAALAATQLPIPPATAATPSPGAPSPADSSPDTPIDAATDAAPDASRLGITPGSAAHQAELVRGEDSRLVDVRVADATRAGPLRATPFRVRSSGLYTLVLTARRNAYTLDDLRVLAPQTFLLRSDGSYLLREHIVVESGATLAIAPQRPTTIRLASGVEGFVSIVAHGGRLRLLGTAAAPLTIESWDTTAGRPDTQLDDGRAYVLSIGQLIARHTSFVQLGFWSGRTGGLAMVGSDLRVAPVDPAAAKAKSAGASSSRRQTSVLPTGAIADVESSVDTSPGEVSDSRTEGNAFGLFVSGVAGVKIGRVALGASRVSGLVLHRGMSSGQVESVTVTGSGLDGIVIARGVEGTVVTRSVVRGNGRDGIVVAGSPLATGPSPSGASTRPFGSNVLSTNEVSGNQRSGIRAVGGTSLRLIGNSVSGGAQGILVAHGATGVVVDGNRITDVAANGIQVRDSTGVEVTGNTMRRLPTGIHVAGARVDLRDNTVAGATLHALTFVGDVQGSSARDNALEGSGSSAIDLARTTVGHGPNLAGNDISRWRRTVTRDTVMSTLAHPMTVVWLLIGLTLLATRRAPRQGPGRQMPYPDSPPAPASALAIEADQDAALAAAGVLQPQPVLATVGAAATAPTGSDRDPDLVGLIDLRDPVGVRPRPAPAAVHPGYDAAYQAHGFGHPGHIAAHGHGLVNGHGPVTGHGPAHEHDAANGLRAAHRHGRQGTGVVAEQAIRDAGPGLLGVDGGPGPGADTAAWLRSVGAL